MADHKSFISSLNILLNQEDDDFSCLYWITKLHNNLYDNCLIFHICKEDKPIIYMKDSEIGRFHQHVRFHKHPRLYYDVKYQLENPKTSLIPLWCQPLPNMSDSVPQTCPTLQRNNIILPSDACLQICPCFSIITIL